MNNFSMFTERRIKISLFTLCLILFVSSPLFAQRGWHHDKSDSTLFKHRIQHYPNDTIFAHRMNDSIFKHHLFDTNFICHNWNDTFFFHHHFDTTFAHNWHNRIDSLKHARLDSIHDHHFYHRFDTICAKHDWNDTLLGKNDTICHRHWNDTITIHHHRNFVVFVHHVNFGTDNETMESDVIVNGSANSSITNSIAPIVIIYPNPMSQNATLRIVNSSEGLTFRLFEITGQQVMSMLNLSNGDFELNRNNLPAGMYFYQVLNGNSPISNGKIVIQ